MASSSCVRCNGHAFQVVEGNVAGASFRLMFVQCSSCGGVVGVQDFLNIGAMLEDVQGAIERVRSKVSSVEHEVSQLAR